MLDKNYRRWLKNHLVSFGTIDTLKHLNRRFRRCIAGKCWCSVCYIGDRALAIKIIERLNKKQEKKNVRI